MSKNQGVIDIFVIELVVPKVVLMNMRSKETQKVLGKLVFGDTFAKVS